MCTQIRYLSCLRKNVWCTYTGYIYLCSCYTCQPLETQKQNIWWRGGCGGHKLKKKCHLQHSRFNFLIYFTNSKNALNSNEHSIKHCFIECSEKHWLIFGMFLHMIRQLLNSARFEDFTCCIMPFCPPCEMLISQRQTVQNAQLSPIHDVCTNAKSVLYCTGNCRFCFFG